MTYADFLSSDFAAKTHRVDHDAGMLSDDCPLAPAIEQTLFFRVGYINIFLPICHWDIPFCFYQVVCDQHPSVIVGSYGERCNEYYSFQYWLKRLCGAKSYVGVISLIRPGG